ncbi:DUF1491 family protein [Sphingomonas quercus]|uniref:DUF1491 family protein n=1 Tax=Sphingomonas quercus TaxID=2842451 RepID=A0ABS6BF31_9SPHN|nr:DUF1491 family protein [Sphingomonas quercus]MBU3076918.1 DUF1491 family protein [Sphingomonas quercus]
MSARLPARLIVTALMRRAQAEGGSAAVLARGDDQAGAVLLIVAQRGEITRIIERGHDLDGAELWRDAAPQVLEGKADLNDYLTRRRHADPDLWAVELDIADSQRFIAETIASN